MQSIGLAEALVNANISSILDMMRTIKKHTKSGYTPYNMTNLVKNTVDLHNSVKQSFTAAILECCYIRKHGSARSTTWHWLVDEPTVNMATKVFEACIRLSKTKATNKVSDIKSKLVPFNGTKTTETIVKQLEIDLRKINAKSVDGELQPVDNAIINPAIIRGLCDLGYIQYKANNLAFTWTGPDPDLDLAKLLCSDTKIAIALGLKNMPNRPPNTINAGRRRSTNEQTIERITHMCELFKDNYKTKAITALNKANPEKSIQWYYLPYIKAFVENGKWIGPMPSAEVSAEIVYANKNGTNPNVFVSTLEIPKIEIPKQTPFFENAPHLKPLEQSTVTEHKTVSAEPVDSSVRNQKQAMLKILEDEILVDDVINQEFKILLTNLDAIDSLRASMNILKESVKPTMNKLGAMNTKVNYYLLLRKEQENEN